MAIARRKAKKKVTKKKATKKRVVRRRAISREDLPGFEILERDRISYKGGKETKFDIFQNPARRGLETVMGRLIDARNALIKAEKAAGDLDLLVGGSQEVKALQRSILDARSEVDLGPGLMSAQMFDEMALFSSTSRPKKRAKVRRRA